MHTEVHHVLRNMLLKTAINHDLDSWTVSSQLSGPLISLWLTDCFFNVVMALHLQKYPICYSSFFKTLLCSCLTQCVFQHQLLVIVYCSLLSLLPVCDCHTWCDDHMQCVVVCSVASTHCTVIVIVMLCHLQYYWHVARGLHRLLHHHWWSQSSDHFKTHRIRGLLSVVMVWVECTACCSSLVFNCDPLYLKCLLISA